MSSIADSLDEHEQLQAFRSLRNARRRNRITKVDLFDAFYKAYLTAIGAVAGVYAGSAALGQRKLNDYHLNLVQTQGPAWVGLFVALAIAIGLRSGGRGGPLAFERADVRHVLLSPIDKRSTIRQPALRQLRYVVFLGASIGAGAGIVAAGRMPHAILLWVLCGALFGAVLATTAFGVALLSGGLQIKRWVADLVALVVLGWSAADIALKLKTSPMTWAGVESLWPLHFDLVGIASIVVAFAAAGFGATYINRLSIEAAERRSRLIGQLRFAATLQDVRTVMVIQRQLSQEQTRMKPWIRRRPWKRTGLRRGRVTTSVYTRRAVAGMLRWPLVRYVRLVIFVAIGALSCVGIWGGTTVLVIVGGLALWLAALDLVEGLAQEVDHPDRSESFPRAIGSVLQSQLLTPFLVLFALEAIAFVLLATFGDANLVDRMSPTVFISALCAVGGASFAVTQKPAIQTGGMVSTPEIAGLKFIFRMVLPPAISIIGLLPVVAAARGWQKTHTIVGLLAQQSKVTTLALVISVWPIVWLRYAQDFKGFVMTPPEEIEAKKNKSKENIAKKVAPSTPVKKSITTGKNKNTSKKKGKK